MAKLKAEDHCSEAQSTDRLPAPCVVTFHPFKTQREERQGSLTEEKELKVSPDAAPGRVLRMS